MIDDSKNKKSFFYGHSEILICLILFIITSAVYLQVLYHGFVIFDDPEYVIANPHIINGLTIKSIIWSFTAEVQGNWHPLTLLSHMLDCQLYGLNPGPHHITSLFLHILNTLLLFLVLKRMTDALWKSAFAAALFALHPLHIESVAWVAERKDVLSTLFWMLTMWCYVRYAQRPDIKRYTLVLFPFVLGLTAKPMLVTLPFVLLLLDYWPLKRIHFGKPGNWRLLLEKVPLFAISAASSIVTCVFQESGKLVASLANVSISVRIENALVSYVNYICKMFWPFNLAVLYPHPQILPWWKVSGACLLLASIFFLAIKLWRRHPYITVGWLWYMGTLVPVIGLVQVGAQAMADRYTYVPLIGLFIAVAWGAPGLVTHWRHKKIALTVAAVMLLSIFTTATVFQLRYWTDSTRLLEQTLRVTSNNWVTHYNLGAIMAEQKKTAQAVMHFSETPRINPNIEEAHFNLGVIKAHHGMTIQAINHFSEALRINPRLGDAHYHLGVALDKTGRTNDAVKHFSLALQTNPRSAEAHNNMGTALIKMGRMHDAIKHFSEALCINPAYAKPHYNLGIVLANEGRFSEAIKHFSESLRLNPGDAEAHNILGGILLNQGRATEAISHYTEALRIKPGFAEAHRNLNRAQALKGGKSN